MKKLLFITVLTLFFTNLNAQDLYPLLYDNSGGITEGYGAWGMTNYVREASVEVPDKGVITFYHPDEAASPKATVFFISGWGRTYESYDRFFKYMVSLGYVVVNIYNYNPGNIPVSYANSVSMMEQAVADYADWIDTSKVGLMGHSYGGGSCIWLGKQVFDAGGLNWGSNGRFIMTFSPWLSFLMEREDLQNYPENVKLVILQSYDDLHNGGPNYNTDPRATRAVYELINIPDTEKDFITIFSDEDENHSYEYNGETYTYLANHYICYTDFTDGYNNPYDRLDVYSSNRLAHALLSYVFEGDNTAKNVALGNGSSEQKDMGIMPDLAVTDYYITTRPESAYEYRCSEDGEGTWGDPSRWKLQDYCEDSDGDGVIDYLGTDSIIQNNLSLYPVPAESAVKLRFKSGIEYLLSIAIYDISGKKVFTDEHPKSYTLDVSQLASGTYILEVRTPKITYRQKFQKQ